MSSVNNSLSEIFGALPENTLDAMSIMATAYSYVIVAASIDVEEAISAIRVAVADIEESIRRGDTPPPPPKPRPLVN